MTIDALWSRPESPLRFARQLMPGDDAMGYLSGLAAANCFPSAKAFCQMLRIRQDDLWHGKTGAVESLAKRGGAGTSDILQHLIVYRSGNAAAIGSHYVGADIIVDPWKHLRFCPACFNEDIASHPKRRPETLIRPRLSHQFIVVGACPRHNIAIAQVEHDPEHGYDTARLFAKLVESNHPSLTPVPQDSTRLARFIEDRLSGEQSHNPFWQGQTLSEVIRSSIAIAALESMGRDYALNKIVEHPKLAGRGFDVLNGGEHTVFQVLDDAVAELDVSDRHGLPGSRALGRFGLFLLQHASTPQFAELRALTAKFLVERKLVRLGDPLIFGLPRPSRNYESLSTLAQRYQTSERMLRQALIAARFLDPAVVKGVKDSKVFLELNTVAEFLDTFAARMTKVEVAAFLGIDERKVLELVKASVLAPPIVRTSSDRKPLMFFSRPDIEMFRSRMLIGRAEGGREGLVSAQSASRIVQRPLWTILQMIHERKLARVVPNGTRLDEILVDANEIAAKVRPAPPAAYSVADCNVLLELSPKNVGALLERGHLTCIMVPRPTGNGSRRAVCKAELDAFHERYISISEMARVYGVGWKGVVTRLRSFGIGPRFTTEEVGAPMFHRKEIETFFAEDGLSRLRRTFKRSSSNWRPPARELPMTGSGNTAEPSQACPSS